MQTSAATAAAVEAPSLSSTAESRAPSALPGTNALTLEHLPSRYDIPLSDASASTTGYQAGECLRPVAPASFTEYTRNGSISESSCSNTPHIHEQSPVQHIYNHQPPHHLNNPHHSPIVNENDLMTAGSSNMDSLNSAVAFSSSVCIDKSQSTIKNAIQSSDLTTIGSSPGASSSMSPPHSSTPTPIYDSSASSSPQYTTLGSTGGYGGVGGECGNRSGGNSNNSNKNWPGNPGLNSTMNSGGGGGHYGWSGYPTPETNYESNSNNGVQSMSSGLPPSPRSTPGSSVSHSGGLGLGANSSSPSHSWSSPVSSPQVPSSPSHNASNALRSPGHSASVAPHLNHLTGPHRMPGAVSPSCLNSPASQAQSPASTCNHHQGQPHHTPLQSLKQMVDPDSSPSSSPSSTMKLQLQPLNPPRAFDPSSTSPNSSSVTTSTTVTTTTATTAAAVAATEITSCLSPSGRKAHAPTSASNSPTHIEPNSPYPTYYNMDSNNVLCSPATNNIHHHSSPSNCSQPLPPPPLHHHQQQHPQQHPQHQHQHQQQHINSSQQQSGQIMGHPPPSMYQSPSSSSSSLNSVKQGRPNASHMYYAQQTHSNHSASVQAGSQLPTPPPLRQHPHPPPPPPVPLSHSHSLHSHHQQHQQHQQQQQQQSSQQQLAMWSEWNGGSNSHQQPNGTPVQGNGRWSVNGTLNGQSFDAYHQTSSNGPFMHPNHPQHAVQNTPHLSGHPVSHITTSTLAPPSQLPPPPPLLPNQFHSHPNHLPHSHPHPHPHPHQSNSLPLEAHHAHHASGYASVANGSVPGQVVHSPNQNAVYPSWQSGQGSSGASGPVGSGGPGAGSLVGSVGSVLSANSNSAIESPALPGGGPAPGVGQVQKKKRGRPFGSKNKPKNIVPSLDGSPAVDAPKKKGGRKPRIKNQPQAQSLATVPPPASLHQSPQTPPLSLPSLQDQLPPLIPLASQDLNSGKVASACGESSLESSFPRGGGNLNLNPSHAAVTTKAQEDLGPFIRVETDRLSNTSVYTISDFSKDLLRDPSSPRSPGRHRPANRFNHASAMSDLTSNSWVCVFCKLAPHYEGLGDLFGPYYISCPSSKPRGSGQGASGNESSVVAGACDSKRAKVDSPCNINNNNNSKDAVDELSVEIWFHGVCISWSSGVYLLGSRIQHMEEIVRDSAESMCSSCALTGANLGCIYSGCHERFHFLCAKRSDCDFNEGNFSILCARHKGKYNRTSLDNNPDSFMTSTLF